MNTDVNTLDASVKWASWVPHNNSPHVLVHLLFIPGWTINTAGFVPLLQSFYNAIPQYGSLHLIVLKITLKKQVLSQNNESNCVISSFGLCPPPAEKFDQIFTDCLQVFLWIQLVSDWQWAMGEVLQLLCSVLGQALGLLSSAPLCSGTGEHVGSWFRELRQKNNPAKGRD